MNNEPATKQDVQDLKQEMQQLEARMDVRMQEMEYRIVDRLTEFSRDMETRLLTAFHGYGKGQAARMHSVEIGQGDMLLRFAALEERVLNLETRGGSGAH